MSFWEILSVGYFPQEIFKVHFWLSLLGLCILGYLLGSLNFAVIISKLFFHEDIRNQGSKNASLTNMLRVYGKTAAIYTLIGDVFKTVIACMIGRVIFGDTGAAVAGLGCILGHAFPIYYHFKGGKGVLATAAMALCLNPFAFGLLIAFFIAIVAVTKYVSLGSVMGALLFPIVLSKTSEPNMFSTIVSVIAAILIVILHRANIKRILDGTESKIDFKSKKKKT